MKLAGIPWKLWIAEINARKDGYNLPDRVNWRKYYDAGYSPAQAAFAAEWEREQEI